MAGSYGGVSKYDKNFERRFETLIHCEIYDILTAFIRVTDFIGRLA